MKKTSLLAIALTFLAGCRCHVQERTTVIHDTIALQQSQNALLTRQDSLCEFFSGNTQAIHATIDSAGRVRTITKVITRCERKADVTSRNACIVHDTITITAGKNEKNTYSNPKNSSKNYFPYKKMILFFLATIIAYFVYKRAKKGL